MSRKNLQQNEENEKQKSQKKDKMSTQLFGNKENSHPNMNDKPGRYSL